MLRENTRSGFMLLLSFGVLFATVAGIDEISTTTEPHCVNGGLYDSITEQCSPCNHGFKGRLCEETFDPCDYKPCQNEAVCKVTEHDGRYQCECERGWQGENCTEDVNECRNAPCGSHGTCVNLQPGEAPTREGFFCNCDMGFEGIYCEKIRPACKNDTFCSGHGSCNADNGCDCDTGWVGPQCKIRINSFPYVPWWAIAVFVTVGIVSILLLVFGCVCRRGRDTLQELPTFLAKKAMSAEQLELLDGTKILPYFETPIIEAVRLHDVEKVRDVIRAHNLIGRSWFNDRDQHGNTPLHLAVLSTRAVMQAILETDQCDLYATNKYGQSVLVFGSAQSSSRVVLAHAPSTISSHRLSSLVKGGSSTASQSHTPVVSRNCECLVEGTEATPAPEGFVTPAEERIDLRLEDDPFEAARYYALALERDLSKRGASATMRSFGGRLMAGGQGVLDEAWSNVIGNRRLMRDNFGRGCLHYAVTNYDVPWLRFALELGANVDSKDEYDDTPLHIAARMAAKELVEILLDHGANTDILNASGATPEIVASDSGFRSGGSWKHVEVETRLRTANVWKWNRRMKQDDESPLRPPSPGVEPHDLAFSDEGSASVFGSQLSLNSQNVVIRKGSKPPPLRRSNAVHESMLRSTGHTEYAFSKKANSLKGQRPPKMCAIPEVPKSIDGRVPMPVPDCNDDTMYL